MSCSSPSGMTYSGVLSKQVCFLCKYRQKLVEKTFNIGLDGGDIHMEWRQGVVRCPARTPDKIGVGVVLDLHLISLGIPNKCPYQLEHILNTQTVCFQNNTAK